MIKRGVRDALIFWVILFIGPTLWRGVGLLDFGRLNVFADGGTAVLQSDLWLGVGKVHPKYYTSQVSNPNLHGLPGWEGVDITAGCGSLILAPFNGRVSSVGTDGYNHVENGRVFPQNSKLSLVSHNLRFEMTLLHGVYYAREGDIVSRGDVLGRESNIGWTVGPTGCHSHIILRDNGRLVNYLDYAASPSVPAVPCGELIAKYASINGIDPMLFAAQIQHESGFDAGAVGGAGEIGLGQLMPGIRDWCGISNAYDPEQNLECSARFLGMLMGKYGDTSLALAAYNAGEPAVDACNCVPDNGVTVGYVSAVHKNYRQFVDSSCDHSQP